MAAKFFSLLALGVGGIIIADIIIHPTGTAVAFNGAGSNLIKPGINGLLGKTA